MLNAIATREDAQEVARRLRDELPELLKSQPITKSQKSEYTAAIWLLFKRICSERNWDLYPAAQPTKGRGKGEYLVDFALFDSAHGCRIACESDWGERRDVEWAFDKLRGVKADIKILVFEAKRIGKDLNPKYAENFKKVLSKSHHHHPGREIYIFVQFETTEALLYMWAPIKTGPLSAEEIVFERFD